MDIQIWVAGFVEIGPDPVERGAAEPVMLILEPVKAYPQQLKM